jgi:hypothetical protein
MGSFAGLPGGKIKNGMTDAKKAATTIEKVKEGAELFKEWKEGQEAVDKAIDAITPSNSGKTTKTTYDNGNGYNYTVENANSSNAEAKKDSTKLMNGKNISGHKTVKVIIE